MAGVVGEAGLGKTRLCFEFLERCRAQGLQVEGHEVAHGKNIPFLPMLQVFRAYYGITQEDSDRSARDKIAERMLFQPDIHEARAELARQRGDEAGYQRELREAHRRFTEMGATGHAERISRELSAVGAQPEEQ